MYLEKNCLLLRLEFLRKGFLHKDTSMSNLTNTIHNYLALEENPLPEVNFTKRYRYAKFYKDPQKTEDNHVLSDILGIWVWNESYIWLNGCRFSSFSIKWFFFSIHITVQPSFNAMDCMWDIFLCFNKSRSMNFFSIVGLV